MDYKIIDSLKRGGVGLLPADTIYGISGLALDKKAVDKIYRLKGRQYSQPFIVLIADTNQAKKLGLNSKYLEPLEDIWPAPVTLVVPTSNRTPDYLHRGTNTLAVRVPNDSTLRELINLTGPLVSTSANPQGSPPAETAGKSREYFGDQLDFYVNAGQLSGLPSVVIKYDADGNLVILRHGDPEVENRLPKNVHH